MEIIIDKTDFWNLEIMRYWSFPKNYDIEKKREESKFMCTSGEYYGARKMDGAFNMIIKDENGVLHMRSRTAGVNGGFVDKADWIPHICKELEDLPNGTVVLGEIYFPDNEGSRKITSVLNCLKSKCLERQEQSGYLHYYIFDIIAYGRKSLIRTQFEKRIDFLNKRIKPIVEKANFIELAEYKSGKELWDLYGEVIACGGEGIVITHRTCEYLVGKRTARMTLKMKKEINQTIDAFLSGNYKPATKEYTGKAIETWNYWLNEKSGKKVKGQKFDDYCNGETWTPITKPYYYGWAGSIELCVLKDGKEIPIGYISGVSDTIKERIVTNPHDYIHRVYEVSCMEVEHIDNHYSLRHGKVLGERIDKDWRDCDFSQIAE